MLDTLITFLKRPNLGLLQNLAGRPPWSAMDNALPWTDRPDALDELGRRVRSGAIAQADAAHVEQWIREGWVVLDDIAPPADVEQVNAALDHLWQTRRPHLRLKMLGVRQSAAEAPRDIAHPRLVMLDAATRRQMQMNSSWRIHRVERYCDAARRLYELARLQRLASTLFGVLARPCASIAFLRGSEQAAHQDMAVFHIYPLNFLIGAWIALEDVTADSGPLFFYPGSHKEPLFEAFRGYPQINLRTAGPGVGRAYQEYMNELTTKKYERREFLAKKGQVLLWHGMLIHGGSAIHDPSRTRRSYVVHFNSPHADRGHQIKGPYNWS